MTIKTLTKFRLLFYAILFVCIILSIFLGYYCIQDAKESGKESGQTVEENKSPILRVPSRVFSISAGVNAILYLICAMLALKIKSLKKQGH